MHMHMYMLHATHSLSVSLPPLAKNLRLAVSAGGRPPDKNLRLAVSPDSNWLRT